MTRPQLEALAAAGSLDGLGEPSPASRRSLLWAAGAVAQATPDRLPGIYTGAEAPALPEPTAVEEVGDDLWALGMAPERTAMDIARPRLDEMGVVRAGDLCHRADRSQVRVAGVVTHRQHPDSAHGMVFVNLEDETGHANLVFSPGAWVRWRHVARRAPVLLVSGRLERGQDAINVVAQRVEAVDLGAPVPPSRDFRRVAGPGSPIGPLGEEPTQWYRLPRYQRPPRSILLIQISIIPIHMEPRLGGGSLAAGSRVVAPADPPSSHVNTFHGGRVKTRSRSLHGGRHHRAVARPGLGHATLIRVLCHVAAALPIIVVATVEGARGWTPLVDDAAIAWRSWDVLSMHSPLVGHMTEAKANDLVYGLGPLQNWILAIPVRLFPDQGALWGAAIVCVAASSLAIEAAWSMGRWTGAVIASAAVLVLVMTRPDLIADLVWNPTMGVFWLLATVACGCVAAAGRLGWWPAAVLSASISAQCHEFYAIPALAICLVSFFVGLAARRARR